MYIIITSQVIFSDPKDQKYSSQNFGCSENDENQQVKQSV